MMALAKINGHLLLNCYKRKQNVSLNNFFFLFFRCFLVRIFNHIHTESILSLKNWQYFLVAGTLIWFFQWPFFLFKFRIGIRSLHDSICFSLFFCYIAQHHSLFWFYMGFIHYYYFFGFRVQHHYFLTRSDEVSFLKNFGRSIFTPNTKLSSSRASSYLEHACSPFGLMHCFISQK